MLSNVYPAFSTALSGWLEVRRYLYLSDFASRRYLAKGVYDILDKVRLTKKKPKNRTLVEMVAHFTRLFESS